MFLSLPVSDLNSEGDSEMSLTTFTTTSDSEPNSQDDSELSLTTFTTASDSEPNSQGDSDSELRWDGGTLLYIYFSIL